MARHDEERAKRLAAALRENLKRRKAQAREGVEGLRPEPVKKDAAEQEPSSRT
ncbi:MAG TPA: hypothetical protein VEC11_15235 [Allosphingosinicella sp.]|nr:hypothetical protein [Allosphingosinicella sp.]